MNYSKFTRRDLIRRRSTSPPDTPDYIKATSELDVRNKALTVRITGWAALIAALALLIHLFLG